MSFLSFPLNTHNYCDSFHLGGNLEQLNPKIKHKQIQKLGSRIMYTSRQWSSTLMLHTGTQWPFSLPPFPLPNLGFSESLVSSPPALPVVHVPYAPSEIPCYSWENVYLILDKMQTLPISVQSFEISHSVNECLEQQKWKFQTSWGAKNSGR